MFTLPQRCRAGGTAQAAPGVAADRQPGRLTTKTPA